jgi:multidrug efflux pump subunit AcrB
MTGQSWIQAHRRSVLFLFAAIVAAGLLSIKRMPVGLFPHVSFPRVVVSLDAGDRPATRMAVEVTTPVEETLRAIPGVRSIRSSTSRGSAEISVNFEWGGDLQAALLQVQSALAQLAPQLPASTTFLARRMDPIVFPVLGFTLTSDSHSLVELRDLALFQLRPILSTTPGVSRIAVLGGAEEEYRVTVDPAKLASYGLTVEDADRGDDADDRDHEPRPHGSHATRASV